MLTNDEYLSYLSIFLFYLKQAINLKNKWITRKSQIYVYVFVSNLLFFF